MIYKSSSSALINAVNYLNFRSGGSKLETLHASLLKIALCHCNFSKNFTISANSDIGKSILIAASDEKFISKIFLNGSFSKTPAKIHLR